ncbi:MAG TPA: class I SAM-dependent methyltransferase [Solirubrobacteraceae bacterium]|nr:class I SAM-dependent methyltransferase [Solirubrobacteraceae bacterium]
MADAALDSPSVAAVLDRIHAAATVEDEQARQRVEAREARLGRRLAQAHRYELYGEAPLAIKREVGGLLYLLALGTPDRRVVEFGASHGASTVYLAAALRDSGGGALITTERHPGKAETLARNLIDAGLDDLVEVRGGDALQTLGKLADPVDLLFLDGSNDLYLQVLKLVEPYLCRNALVVADLSADDPDLRPYLDYVRNAENGYVSVEVPLAAGVQLSARIITR